MRSCNTQRSKAPAQRKPAALSRPQCAVTPVAGGALRLELFVALPVGAAIDRLRDGVAGFAAGTWARFGTSPAVPSPLRVMFEKRGRRLRFAFDTVTDFENAGRMREVAESYGRALQLPERWISRTAAVEFSPTLRE